MAKQTENRTLPRLCKEDARALRDFAAAAERRLVLTIRQYRELLHRRRLAYEAACTCRHQGTCSRCGEMEHLDQILRVTRSTYG